VRISVLQLGSPGTKNHLDVAPVESHRIYYKGEGGGFPQVRALVSLVCLSCLWLVLTPKVFQLCTNHFVLVLCKFVWVIEACHFFLVPSWSSSTPLYRSIVLQAKERAPTPYSSIVLVWDSHLSPSRSWERVKHGGCMRFQLWPCFAFHVDFSTPNPHSKKVILASFGSQWIGTIKFGRCFELMKE
jgi:hypothetical protein